MGSIRTDIQKGIATLTIDNVAKRNAMSLQMWRDLKSSIQALEQNSAARVIIVRGEGQEAFVSGADISEFDQLRHSPESVRIYDETVEDAEAAVLLCKKPVIAAISGFCVGGGLGIMLACDLRYASRHAKFRMPAGRLGLGYGLPDIKRMQSIVGIARATEMLFTAKVYDAKEAEHIGLIHSSHDDVFAYAWEQAQLVSDNAPLTLRAAKMGLQALYGGPHAPTAENVSDAVMNCFTSQDYQEGRKAFAEKRTPVFKGH